MKKISMLTVMLGLVSLPVLAQVPLPEHQIGAAVAAAPEDAREGAAVLGYDAYGKLVTLREGRNALVCLADDPEEEGFSVACYHRDLEPFMTRGRQLRAEGKAFKEVFDIREAEVQAGTLKMPAQPTTLYVLSGKEGRYDPATGAVEKASLRFVVYVPYATAEASGLPTQPTGPGEPWLMDAGTHRAHIMITPPPPAAGQ
jgi:hypothetical protein